MTIEVRQMLIKSQVTAPQPRPAGPAWTEQETERLRRELLDACKAWLADKLQEQKER